ncbi:MAG: MarR family transcriptional regulator [Paenibacillaceae bacterium]|uniref:MarR family winged helix-turn-helix transcriptional regulator n=1 Tax=Paenibacillus cymbidii TaxID=1639034 RepID=UPI00108093D9|nr:MarR family transcriptional regulator [Paenibacillus cymbidii]MBO9606446.1 MarR family transcriptional regulator [Paenibacillaceae bacterium]
MNEQQRVVHIFQTYREINQAFFQVMSKAARQHGITPLQLIVLRLLNEYPSCSLTRLAENLNLGNSTTSGIIDRMVRAELVTRERTETDRRAMTLTLTEKGKRLWHDSDATRMRMLSGLLEISPEDLLELERIQLQVLRILRKVREDV